MRKLVKAAAALTAGCMLLSTSAFAMTSNLSVDGENLLTNGAITVNITGLNAGQSTIMVLKGDAALEDASEANIVYINQADIVDGAASYNVNLGTSFEGTATVYAGGTAENATKLGVLSAAKEVAGLTLAADKTTLEIGETATITPTFDPADATNKTLTWENATATDDGLSATFTATEAGTFTVKATTANGKEATVVITVNAPAANVIYGDVDGDEEVTSLDALNILKVSLGATIDGFNEAAADVDCDGDITSLDALNVLKVSLGADITLGPSKN